MGGSNSASPPKYSSSDTLKAGRDQTTITAEAIPRVTAAAGTANRTEELRNRFFGLEGILNPGMVYTQRADDMQRELSDMSKWKTSGKKGNKRYINPTTGERLTKQQFDALKERRTDEIASLRERDPLADFTNAFSDQFASRDAFMNMMRGAEDSTSEFQRMQDAYGRGTTARLAQGASVEAGRADRVADITAGEVGAGELGQSLMARARSMADSQGTLSPEAAREATQAARQAFASRGLATGNAAIGAELLNRDRFARQRMFEDLNFARGIQEQDLGRQRSNVDRALEAARANQSMAGTLSIADLNALMQARGQTAALAQANNQFNAGQMTDADRYNMGLLGTSAQAADIERTRRLGLGQDIYNFGMGTAPSMLLAGLGSPYANMTAPSLGLANLNIAPMYTGGQFSGGGFNMGGAGSGALSGAAMMAPTGNPYLIAGGAAVGGVSGGLS